MVAVIFVFVLFYFVCMFVFSFSVVVVVVVVALCLVVCFLLILFSPNLVDLVLHSFLIRGLFSSSVPVRLKKKVRTTAIITAARINSTPSPISKYCTACNNRTPP